MATTDYRTATTTNRNAQTPINRTSGDRNEVSRGNNTAIWIVVAIVALAAIAYAMGAFGPMDEDAAPSSTMASDTYAPSESSSTSPMVTPGSPDATQTTISPAPVAGASDSTTAPAAAQ